LLGLSFTADMAAEVRTGDPLNTKQAEVLTTTPRRSVQKYLVPIQQQLSTVDRNTLSPQRDLSPDSPVIMTHSFQCRTYRLYSEYLRIPYVSCSNLGLEICIWQSISV